jgi:hypothetical protein
VILIDEFHRTASSQYGPEERVYDEIRRTLDGTRLQVELRRVLREICQRDHSLRQARVTVSR